MGATILSSVIGRLRESKLLTTPANVAADIVVGLDDPDDAAVIRPPKEGHVTVHTVDFFRSFLDDPYTFGQVAANHALSDCHAMCADAHSALVSTSCMVFPSVMSLLLRCSDNNYMHSVLAHLATKRPSLLFRMVCKKKWKKPFSRSWQGPVPSCKRPAALLSEATPPRERSCRWDLR